eukprot:6460705-Amphidinium_carterae.1
MVCSCTPPNTHDASLDTTPILQGTQRATASTTTLSQRFGVNRLQEPLLQEHVRYPHCRRECLRISLSLCDTLGLQQLASSAHLLLRH